MQLTIEIPDKLANQLEPQLDKVAEIIECGLREQWSESSSIAQEVIAFLAMGPSPKEIVSFRPSKQSIERTKELLEKNRAGTLTTEENAELDQMARMDHLMTLIKAKAFQHSRAAA